MPPRANVSPSASATATSQPPQAGINVVPQDLAKTLSNIVNTLRTATAESVNPRVSPVTAEALSRQSLRLQTDANQISARLDALPASGGGALAIYQDLNVLGGEVQNFVQAVINALEGVGEGPRAHGGVRLGALPTPEEEAKAKARTWIVVGVVSAVALAGLGAWLVSRQTKPRFGKIKGTLSAR
jgi:hypothetical protein